MNEKQMIKEAMEDKTSIDKGEVVPAMVERVVKTASGIKFVAVQRSIVEGVAELKKCRHETGDGVMTQKDFSALLGIPLSTYRKYEQHESRIPVPVLKLAKIASRDIGLIPS